MLTCKCHNKLTLMHPQKTLQNFCFSPPLQPELTHLNFPALYARKQPFGILFLNPSLSQASQLAVVNIIKSNEVPDLVFCKMYVTLLRLCVLWGGGWGVL